MASKFRTWTKGDKSMSVEWLTARDILSTPDRYNADYAARRSSARASMGNEASTVSRMFPIASPSDDIPDESWCKHSNSAGLQVPQQRSRANTAPPTPRLAGETSKLVELPGSEPPLTSSTQTATCLVVNDHQPTTRTALAVGASHSPPGSEAGSRPSIHGCVSPLADNASSPTPIPDTMAQMLATRLHDTITPLPCARSVIQPTHLPYPIDEDGSDIGPQQSYHATAMSPEASVRSPDELARADGASVLWQQLANLRHAHEVHLLSLKDAHMKELAGHLSYISFLETRSRGTIANVSQYTPYDGQAAPVLRIDTSQRFVPMCELPAHEINDFTRSSPKNNPQQISLTCLDSATEIESLKRQLSTARREQVEAIQLSLQHRQIKKECKQRHRENQRLLADLQQLQSTTQTMRTTIDNLEAQLVSANNERIDVLEGYHDACAQIVMLSQVKADGPARDQSITLSSSGTQTEGCVLLGMDGNDGASDCSIKTCREAHKLTVITTLQEQLAHKDGALRQAEIDRENLKALLMEEVRRQSRQSRAHQRGSSPSVDMQAGVRLRGIVADAAFAAGKPGDSAAGNGVSLAGLLEKELESLLRQNIMQKVQLKEVKNELKHARADLSALQVITTPRPPTPEDSTHESAPTTPDTDVRLHKRGSSHGGLNISMASSPALNQDRSGRLLRPASAQSLTSAKGPSRRSKTPVGYNKSLPDPPSTQGKASSAESRAQQCSPSDSIYAFYAGEQRSSRIDVDAANLDSAFISPNRKQRVTV